MASILSGQGQLVAESRGLFERFLAISILTWGPDGSNTASGNLNLGDFYCRLAKVQTTVNLEQKQQLLAKAYFEESHRIKSKIYGPTHPDTIDIASQLARVSSKLSGSSLTLD